MPGILERWRQLFRPIYVRYSYGPDAPINVLNMTAIDLYNTQDNLSAVINFLSNSVAQLPLKVYRRGQNDERERDRTSPAALTLRRPNEDQTEFDFIKALLTEYFLFGCVYVWHLPDAESESGKQLRVIPTAWITETEKLNSYAPEKIRVTANGAGTIEIPRSEFVRFNIYAPGNPGGYVSPVSALRQTLEEQVQAGRFRKELWKSSGRLNAQIIRPKDVEKWSSTTREKWIAAFREAWGSGGDKAGAIPLMEDGMEIKPFSTSFKESQWTESVKLSREAVAAAYGVNPSLIWHSDTQTYASSKDNARALYAECLGPVLQMLQQRINSFLLPMLGADPGTYVEFDLAEKLKGSFEERANIIQSSVGGPWLTRNEARRDNNLPPVPGGDKLIVPLNVAIGEQQYQRGENGHLARTKEAAVKTEKAEEVAEEDPIEVSGKVTDKEKNAVAETLSRFIKRQAKSILPKIGAESEWWTAERWNRELADDLEPLLKEISKAHGETVAKALGTDYIIEKTIAYIRKVAEIRAEIINDETRSKIQAAMDEAEGEEDPTESVSHELDKRADFDAPLLGGMLAKTMAGWGTEEAVRQATSQGSRKKAYKAWETGPNARDSHAHMNGETVPIDDRFSNGAFWPGDDSLDPDESCGCNCSTRVIIRGG